MIDMEEFPVVLGGDCSIVLGCLLALRRRGRHGLLFSMVMLISINPRLSRNGEAASMELALATGRGPTIVTDLEGRRPLVRRSNPSHHRIPVAAPAPRILGTPRCRCARRRCHARCRLPHAGRLVMGRTGNDPSGRGHFGSSSRPQHSQSLKATAQSRRGSSMRW